MIDIRRFDFSLAYPAGHLLPAVDRLMQRAQQYVQNRTQTQVRDMVLLVDALVDDVSCADQASSADPESDLARLRRRIAQQDWQETADQPAPSEEELLAAFALANVVLAKETLSMQARIEPDAWTAGSGFLPEPAFQYCLDAAEALASADQLVHVRHATDQVEQSHRMRRQTISSQGANKRLEPLNRLKHDFYCHMKALSTTGKPVCSRVAEPFFKQWLLDHPEVAPDVDHDNITRTLCEGWGKHKKSVGR